MGYVQLLGIVKLMTRHGQLIGILDPIRPNGPP